jgi:hypothetical protein
MISHFSLEQELQSHFGIPTMAEMTKDFKEELRMTKQQENEVYDEIVSLLKQDLDNVDLEAVFFCY